MVRPHLFEFIDLPWYPAALRDLQTDALQRLTGPAFRAVAPLIAETLERTRTDRIVDLCSGGGGPWPTLRTQIAAPITLTDRYPNRPRFAAMRDESDGQVDFAPDPVDAQAVPRHLTGMRTIFSAFHHLRPPEAVALLRDARDAGVPIGVFDVGSARTNAGSLIRTLLFSALAPALFLLTYYVITPKLGPLTWQRIVFVYLLPVVPFVTAWDFLVTALRAYTVEEMRSMVAGLGEDTYEWDVGEIGTKRLPIHYIIGEPSRESR